MTSRRESGITNGVRSAGPAVDAAATLPYKRCQLGGGHAAAAFCAGGNAALFAVTDANPRTNQWPIPNRPRRPRARSRAALK